MHGQQNIKICEYVFIRRPKPACIAVRRVWDIYIACVNFIVTRIYLLVGIMKLDFIYKHIFRMINFLIFYLSYVTTPQCI